MSRKRTRTRKPAPKTPEQIAALSDDMLTYAIDCWDIAHGFDYAMEQSIPAAEQREYARLLAEKDRRPWIAEAERAQIRAIEARFARERARQGFIDRVIAGQPGGWDPATMAEPEA